MRLWQPHATHPLGIVVDDFVEMFEMEIVQKKGDELPTTDLDRGRKVRLFVFVRHIEIIAVDVTCMFLDTTFDRGLKVRLFLFATMQPTGSCNRRRPGLTPESPWPRPTKAQSEMLVPP
jgi:hypothetical protein